MGINLRKNLLLYIIPTIIFIIVLLSFIFIIIPNYNSIINSDNEISAYNTKNTQLNQEISNLENYTSNNTSNKLKSDLAILNTIIPNNLQFVTTSGDVQNMALNSGLIFKNLSSAQLPKSFNSSVTIPGLSSNITPSNVSVSFSGNYSQLKSYINSLITNKILFVVPNIYYRGNLTGNISSDNTLDVKVTFFSSPDISETKYISLINNLGGLDKYLANFQ